MEMNHSVLFVCGVQEFLRIQNSLLFQTKVVVPNMNRGSVLN